MGLLVSAIPRLTSKAAQNIVPLILVPQIILGGALISFDKMNDALTIREGETIPEICQVMPSRWAYEGLVVMQETYNRFHTPYSAMLDSLKELKLGRHEIIDNQGEDTYLAMKDSLESKIEAFDKSYQDQYGNADIHQMVQVADFEFKQMQAEADTASTEMNLYYPMFVSQKKIPFTESLMINTAWYDLGVILLLSFFNCFLALVLLKFLENIIRILDFGRFGIGGRIKSMIERIRFGIK
jgi:hypothetical protein